MTLRNQINIRISISILLVLIIAATIVIIEARYAIKKEINSSVNLAIQLIQWGVLESRTLHNMTLNDKFKKIDSLKETRHLNIQLKYTSGEVIKLTTDIINSEKPQAPDWFIWLVSSQQQEKTYEVSTLDDQPLLIIIKANPMDEINEAWLEARVFFAIICLLSISVFLAINLAFNKVLKTVNVILKGLNSITNEAYDQKLPNFSIDEFKQIAVAINQLTDSLEKTRQEKKALTQHSLQIQEEERRVLSQELHDELGQSLTAIKVIAVTSKNNNGNLEAFDSIISICDHLFIVVRSMMKNLHPMVLTELGLEAALQELVRQWHSRNSQLNILLKCPANCPGNNQKTEIQVFRIIQEAITNTVKHAQASEMSIEIKCVHSFDLDYLSIKISDDGQGCKQILLNSSFGLLAMQNRVQSMDGKIEFFPQHGTGLQIIIKIPLYEN